MFTSLNPPRTFLYYTLTRFSFCSLKPHISNCKSSPQSPDTHLPITSLSFLRVLFCFVFKWSTFLIVIFETYTSNPLMHVKPLKHRDQFSLKSCIHLCASQEPVCKRVCSKRVHACSCTELLFNVNSKVRSSASTAKFSSVYALFKNMDTPRCC